MADTHQTQQVHQDNPNNQRLYPEKEIEIETYYLENIVKTHYRDNPTDTYKTFNQVCQEKFKDNKDIFLALAYKTQNQSDDDAWRRLRYGRISASILYETSRCKTPNGSLVKSYLEPRTYMSPAMARGKNLETSVFNELKKSYSNLEKIGFLIDPAKGICIGASPDGITPDFVLEIKCPSTYHSWKLCTNEDTFPEAYRAQVQLAMHLTGRPKALIAVASCIYEESKEVTQFWIPYDETYIVETIDKAVEFYENNIFPSLLEKFKI